MNSPLNIAQSYRKNVTFVTINVKCYNIIIYDVTFLVTICDICDKIYQKSSLIPILSQNVTENVTL